MLQQRSRANAWRCVWAVVTMAVVSGCSSWGKLTTPEALVNARSDVLLQARMSNDFKQAYAFTSPGYRAVNDYKKFSLKYAVALPLKGGERMKTECTAERCEIVRSYAASMPLMPNATIPIGITEVWVYQDGQWWWHVN